MLKYIIVKLQHISDTEKLERCQREKTVFMPDDKVLSSKYLRKMTVNLEIL